MKGFVLFVAASIMLAGNLSAGEKCNKPRRAVTLRCVTPCDIVLGVGCYTLDVGKRVVKGTGQILTAPFKANLCLPKPRVFKWRPGFWTPGRLYRVPEAPVKDEGLQIELKEIRHRDYYHPLYHPPRDDNMVVLYSKRF
mgnify:FL=1|tara:strand:+ start:79 stop:495 length:417 start_codon:yes stop_codon:yes gene_type:complete